MPIDLPFLLFWGIAFLVRCFHCVEDALSLADCDVNGSYPAAYPLAALVIVAVPALICTFILFFSETIRLFSFI